MFIWRSSNISNVRNNRFGYISFNECCCFFFSCIIDFIDYYDSFSLWIVLEYLKDVDEVWIRNWIVIDINISRLVKIFVSGLFNCFVCKCIRVRNNIYFIRFVDVIRYDINFIFFRSDYIWVVWIDYVNVFCFYVFFNVKYI